MVVVGVCGRSSIAGGVAMGSVANLVAKPWEATLIGAIGTGGREGGWGRERERERERSRGGKETGRQTEAEAVREIGAVGE